MSKSYGLEEKEMCELLDRMTANNEFWHKNVTPSVNFQRFGFQLREVDFEPNTVNNHNGFPLRNRNKAAIANSGLSIIKNDDKEFKITLDVWPFEKNDLTILFVPGKYISIYGEHGERDEDGSSVSRKFQRYYRVPKGSVTDASRILCEHFGDKVTIRVPKTEVLDEVNKEPLNLATFRNMPIPTDKQYSEEMPNAEKLPIIDKSEAFNDLPNKIPIATEDSKKEESLKSEGERDRESTEGVSDIPEDPKNEESLKLEIQVNRQSPEGLSEDVKMSGKELLSDTNGDGATDLRAN